MVRERYVPGVGDWDASWSFELEFESGIVPSPVPCSPFPLSQKHHEAAAANRQIERDARLAA